MNKNRKVAFRIDKKTLERLRILEEKKDNTETVNIKNRHGRPMKVKVFTKRKDAE